MAYAVFSGQPLCILGPTGPELAYALVFMEMCNVLGLDFMTARVWLGLWTALFTTLLALTDACAVMSQYTRFTEEIFAALISIIFIFEALIKVVDAFWHQPFGGAVFTCLLTFHT